MASEDIKQIIEYYNFLSVAKKEVKKIDDILTQITNPKKKTYMLLKSGGLVVAKYGGGMLGMTAAVSAGTAVLGTAIITAPVSIPLITITAAGATVLAFAGGYAGKKITAQAAKKAGLDIPRLQTRKANKALDAANMGFVQETVHDQMDRNDQLMNAAVIMASKGVKEVVGESIPVGDIVKFSLSANDMMGITLLKALKIESFLNRIEKGINIENHSKAMYVIKNNCHDCVPSDSVYGMFTGKAITSAMLEKKRSKVIKHRDAIKRMLQDPDIYLDNSHQEDSVA